MAANKLADEKGLKVGVGLQRRHEPGYIEGVKRHPGRRAGRPALPPRLLERRYALGPSPPAANRRKWSTRCATGTTSSGSAATTSSSSTSTTSTSANWVKGDHPVEANGMGGRQVRKGKDLGHIFDHHFVEFTYNDGTKLYSQCRQQAGTWNCVGECGPRHQGHRPAASSGRGSRPATPTAIEHVDLVKAIRNNEKYNEGWYGATSSMTAVLGRMATYSGQVVHWDDAVAKGPNEMPEKFAWDAKPKVLPDKNGLYEHAVADTRRLQAILTSLRPSGARS